MDDERLARKELRRLLSTDHPSIRIVGEADCVEQALQVLEATSPDLMFLDIQMPGGSGFDVLARWAGVRPATIFVTAYDAYALRAFEVNALDYLLKPVESKRLAEAISRLDSRPAAIPGRLTSDDRLFLETAFVKVADVVCALSAGDYTEIYTAQGARHLVSRPMKAWESCLPEQQFLRIHRGAIVNLDYVEKLTTEGVRLRGMPAGMSMPPLMVSRRHAARLRALARS